MCIRTCVDGGSCELKKKCKANFQSVLTRKGMSVVYEAEKGADSKKSQYATEANPTQKFKGFCFGLVTVVVFASNIQPQCFKAIQFHTVTSSKKRILHQTKPHLDQFEKKIDREV